MGSRAGLCLCLTSLWIVTVAQSAFSNEDLIVDECRIKGIALAKMKDGKYHFNFTSAETVCQQLGLSLASKAQVEKARMDGFETCSYGWVTDGIAVVSRIHRNEKCGQNKTGTATWNAPLAKEFNAYCFNASDMLINSCKPDPTTTSMKTTLTTTFTFEPRTTTANVATITKTLRETQTTMQTRRDVEGYATDVAATSRWPNNVKTLITKSATLLKLTTAELDEDISTPANIKGTLKSEHVVFGGLPTALLILALIFFTAAVVLAVCYVRKYTTTLPITSKAKKTENVEVKVLKDTKTNTKSSNEEQNQNGKPTENPQAKLAAESAAAVAVAENSAEAEI